MDRSEHRTHGGTGATAEDWLHAQLTAHADGIVVQPPDLARIDARRRGIRRRRAGLVACAAAAVTASAVVAAVALTGGGGGAQVATPPTLSTSATPAETLPATTPPTTTPTTEPTRPGATGDGGTVTSTSGAPGPTGTAATGAPQPPGSSSGSPGSPGSPGASGGSGTAACTDKSVKIVMSTTPDSSNHVLLTATNTGSTTCTLYYYPQVVLGDRDPTVPMESPAQALATIGPGKKAYAGLRLWNDADTPPEYPVKSFAVNLQGRVANTPAGNPVDVRVPPEIIALDVGRTPMSTFWNTDLDAVNRYLYAR